MNVIEYYPKLIKAALDGNKKTIEELASLISRRLKKEYPEISLEIANALSMHRVGFSAYRSAENAYDQIPTDKDSRMPIADRYICEEIERPIYNNSIDKIIDGFMLERKNSERLLAVGIEPTSSFLLYGEPGVGKTLFAQWLASEMKVPLVVLNLATAMSSYLGRTGQNIKTVLDYAKRNNVVLLLDEIDAIAKKRDDISDLGELKRLVNVLLKELEDWPGNSILVAATNHPQLLDMALWRRFDINLEIPMPTYEGRREIISKEFKRYGISNVHASELMAIILEKESPANICKLCKAFTRMSVISDKPIEDIILSEMMDYVGRASVDNRREICRTIKALEPSITTRMLADKLGISAATVSRYLAKEG